MAKDRTVIVVDTISWLEKVLKMKIKHVKRRQKIFKKNIPSGRFTPGKWVSICYLLIEDDHLKAPE